MLREEVTGPPGVAGDLFFGVPYGELARVARLEDGGWRATHNRLTGPADDNATLIADTVRDALGRV